MIGAPNDTCEQEADRVAHADATAPHGRFGDFPKRPCVNLGSGDLRDVTPLRRVKSKLFDNFPCVGAIRVEW